VVAAILDKHLRDMAPAQAWPEEFHYGVDTYDVGVPGFATYYCTTAAPEFAAPGGPRTAVSAGLAGWPEEMIQLGADRGPGAMSLTRRGCWWPRRRWPIPDGPRPATTQSRSSVPRSTRCPAGPASGKRPRKSTRGGYWPGSGPRPPTSPTRSSLIT